MSWGDNSTGWNRSHQQKKKHGNLNDNHMDTAPAAQMDEGKLLQQLKKGKEVITCDDSLVFTIDAKIDECKQIVEAKRPWNPDCVTQQSESRN